jgi:hypothetical protein
MGQSGDSSSTTNSTPTAIPTEKHFTSPTLPYFYVPAKKAPVFEGSLAVCVAFFRGQIPADSGEFQGYLQECTT